MKCLTSCAGFLELAAGLLDEVLLGSLDETTRSLSVTSRLGR